MTTTTIESSPSFAARVRRSVGASARVRILAAVLGLLALSTLAAVLLQRQVLLARVGERVDTALNQEVEELSRLVELGSDPRTREPFGTDVEAIFDVFLARNVPGEGERYFTFLADRGAHRTTARLVSERELTERVAALGGVRAVTRGELTAEPPGRVRYLAVPVIADGRQRGTFVVTQALEREEAEVDEAVQVAAGVSLAVLLLASVLAFAAAGRVLSPLRELTDTARGITESDLTRRIEERGDDEIAQLAVTFNAMLDRLERAFGSQRAFISDAGHELRTPITIIRGHLELLGDDPAERRETVALVTDELDRMARFVDDLLTLAKAERTDFLHLADVDLDVLTQELMAKAEALAPRAWTLEAVGAGRLTADRQRLTQALMNLAQNAVQHTGEGTPIALGSAMDGDRARLWVRDRGPGVPLADRERIFERFARVAGGPRRSEGAGLGLAIVRAIAEAHGGRVVLQSQPGEGATFIVEVPVQPPDTDRDAL